MGRGCWVLVLVRFSRRSVEGAAVGLVEGFEGHVVALWPVARHKELHNHSMLSHNENGHVWLKATVRRSTNFY